MVGKSIREGMHQFTHRYARAENKYLKDYDSKKTSYLIYCDLSNFYGQAMQQELPLYEQYTK